MSNFLNFRLPDPGKRIQGLFRDEEEMYEFLSKMPWVLPAVRARVLPNGGGCEVARRPRFEKSICPYCVFSNKLSGWCLLKRLGRRCQYEGSANVRITVAARNRPKPAKLIRATFVSRK